MKPKPKNGKINSNCVLFRICFSFIFPLLFLLPCAGLAQERKGGSQETPDRLSYLIENGAGMITQYESGKVLREIEALPPGKRSDFRIRVLENFASLKSYLVTKKREYGKKWQSDYKPMVRTGNKSATPILVELLKDDDPYVRAFVARALGYLGDQRALEGLQRVMKQDKKSKVRSRAKWAYEHISGGKIPEEQDPLKEE